MECPLEGQDVGRLCLDYGVVLETLDGSELRIESAFRLSSPGKTRSLEVHPDHLDQTGGAVVSLLRQRIESAVIGASGALSLRFANGSRLDCEPDERFEAWTLATAAGEQMVCLPGGGVAHWPAGSPKR